MNPAAGPRILLGQWYSNGDCLFATAIARQIKADFPGGHLTWAIGSRCRELLRGNPHVDAVWEIEQPAGGEIRDHALLTITQWEAFEREVHARQAHGEFDHVFLTFSGGFRNLHLYDGTVRGMLFHGYPRPITVPIAPVLRLDEFEIENVRRFVASHPVMTRCRRVVLFECSPKSGQSAVNPDFALALSRLLLAEFDDLCFVLSSNLPVAAPEERIIDASVLSFRENAELTRYCTLLIGCSSGLTWLSTSEGAKELPTVQIISANAPYPNSLAIDHERHGLPIDHILEMIDADLGRARDCLATVLRDGFAAARTRFHQRMPLTISYSIIAAEILRQGHYRQAAVFLWNTWRREGRRPAMLAMAAGVAWRHGLRLARRGVSTLLRRLWPGWRQALAARPKNG